MTLCIPHFSLIVTGAHGKDRSEGSIARSTVRRLLLARPAPQKRLAALEQIRREYHDWPDDTLHPDFREFIQLLYDHSVRYLSADARCRIFCYWGTLVRCVSHSMSYSSRRR